MRWNFALLSGVCLLAALRSKEAATFTVEPEVDARVINIPGGVFPNQNYETDFLSVYTAPGNVQRTFMRFDLAGITVPAGERVSSAVLSLVASVTFGPSREQPAEVYRVTKPWSEQELTWLSRTTGVHWLTPGGEYVGRIGAPDENPYGTSTANPAQGETVSWDITELVDQWLENVSPNHGLLLRSYEGNGLTFGQREANQTSSRPKLTITTAPGAPHLRAEVSGGQFVLSWRGENVALLEENSSASPSGWAQVGAAPSIANGRSQVTVPAAGARKFFRLRAP